MIAFSNEICRVLVVDDDPAIRASYRRILKPTRSRALAPGHVEATTTVLDVEFDVTEASEGEVAAVLNRCALAAGRPHQMAFIDMRMPPGWSGMQTAMALRAQDPSIYIVIAAAFSDYEPVELESALGRDVVVLRKPFNDEEVYQLARTYCQSWRARQRLESVTAVMEQQVLERSAELKRRVAQRQGLADIATQCVELAAEEEPDDVICWSLARAGRVTEADTVNIFLLGENGTGFSMTHEWLAPGMNSLRDCFQILPEREFQQTIERLRHGEIFRLNGRRSPTPVFLRNLIGRVGSLTCIPLESGNRMIGFINVACRSADMHWDEHDESLLRTVGHILFRTLDVHVAKRRLRDSETQYRELVQSIPGVVYRRTIDADWTVRFMSDYIETLSGYPAADFVDSRRRGFAAIIHPDDVERVDSTVKEAVARKAPYDMEYRIIHADGNLRWVSERGRAAFGAADAVLWLDGVISDITPRKHMEATLATTAEFVSRPADEHFCQQLARHAAVTLSLDYVYVALRQPRHMELLAVWLDGNLLPNLSYLADSGPCADVLQGKRIRILAGAVAHYPRNDLLAMLGAESYVGEPIVDSGGAVLGLLVGGTKAPLQDAEMVQVNLRILAARAGAVWVQREALRALRRQRDTTQNILQTIETCIVALDSEGRITLINRKGCELLGYSQAELIGQDWFSFCLPAGEWVPEAKEVFRRLMAEELLDCEYFENPVLTRSGEHRLVAWHNSCIRDASGKIVGGLSAGEDITERRRAENALNVALTKYKTLFDNFPMGITVTDPGGQALETNAVAERLLGNVAHARMGRGVVRVDGSPMPVEEFASVRALREKRRVENVEMGVVQEDGRTVWISATADLLPLEGYGAVVTYSDITERRAAEERIHQLAYFDPLTNLPNRRLLMDRLGQALIASQRSQNHGAVLIIDLDRFKGLNDSHGHDVGDKLLVEVAQRLIANVRREDTVARLGGDEYVLILEGIGEDRGTAARQADHVAKKVCRALCRPYALTPLSIPYACSASIGLTMFLGDQLSEDVLLKQADIALYQAKGAGRERVMAFQDGIL